MIKILVSFKSNALSGASITLICFHLLLKLLPFVYNQNAAQKGQITDISDDTLIQLENKLSYQSNC